MKTRDEGLTLWRYVIWAPHTFFTGFFGLFVMALGYWAFYRNPPKGRTNDETVLFLLAYSGAAFLIIWLPIAIHKMALLRLLQRRAKSLADELKDIHENKK
jgi:hypothetical protein